jgi:hypothetical protein
MSSYGVGSVSNDIPTEDVRTEAELSEGQLETEKESKIAVKSNERLRSLVSDDNMYEAMENFLLGDPKNQLPQLGTPAEIMGKGDEAKSKGEDLIARAQYETTAKVAIYEQDPDLAKESLNRAAEVTNPTDRHARMQKTIQNNIGEVIRIARDYYETKQEITAETEAEVVSEASAKK